jgi:uncharacterized protein (TIGR00269 family)
VERKIHKLISTQKLVSNEDRICVGVSGGKDSLVLLYNLYQRQQRIKTSPKLSVAFIDEGIKEYRDESVKILDQFMRQFDIEADIRVLEFRKEFGYTMDEISRMIVENNLSMNACTVCGTVRRRLLNIAAKNAGATKLAIGHNLDDTVQTFMLNILRNDAGKIVSVPPYGSPVSSPGENEDIFIPRIKPLAGLSERELTLYCYHKEFPIQSNPCPFSRSFPILRRKVQEFLNNLDERSSEIKFNLLHLNQELISKLGHLENRPKLNSYCKTCGNPTGIKRNVCLYCELKALFAFLGSK